MLLICLVGSAALAQWNPHNGQWGRSDPADLRVMTWNMYDTIRSDNDRKVDAPGAEGYNAWNAAVRIIASMQPDVLILQETGDNTSTPGGGNVDSVADLLTTFDLFLYGGNDPFNKNEPVTSYVHKFAPDYDLPHVFVSERTDGFNRNVILSRYPFADLNGDGRATYSDIPLLSPDAWQQGGRGGIRGFMFAQIDLPDEVYGGNVVIGNAHLKAGGAQNDHEQRVAAAQNVGYYIHHQYNGAGTGQPDPNNAISGPTPTSILDARTPVIWGGDMNEDESAHQRRGPVSWLTAGAAPGDGQGTDRDGSDSAYDDARDPISNNRATFGTNTKLDYIMWQDSIATLRRAFIFDSNTANAANALPPQLEDFPVFAGAASTLASDHRPVIADFILPAADPSAPGIFGLMTPGAGASRLDTTPTFRWSTSEHAQHYVLRIADNPAFEDPAYVADDLTATEHAPPAGQLEHCRTYHWGVIARNNAGEATSIPTSRSFTTRTAADLNQDGEVDVTDFFLYLEWFENADPRADLNRDGEIDITDFFLFLDLFEQGPC